MTLGGEFTLGGLASTTSCAHLYTCPFWFPIGFYLRGVKDKSVKQSGVYNETKVITIIRRVPEWLIIR